MQKALDYCKKQARVYNSSVRRGGVQLLKPIVFSGVYDYLRVYDY